MTVDPAVLLHELQTDPKGLQYAGQPPDGMAALLNTVGASGETCPNTQATMAGVILAIDPAEWGALAQPTRDLLLRVSYLASIDLSDPRVMARIAQIFPASGPTVAALTALATRPCSRAEALFGPGTTVTADDVVSAIALAGGHL